MISKTVKRVLIVDDEEAILLALKKILQRPQIEIDTCECLDGALSFLDKYYYDVVIADLRLSGTLDKSGFEIVKYVKDVSPATKVGLITAYGSHDVRNEAEMLKTDFYFEKPISIKNLYEIIENI